MPMIKLHGYRGGVDADAGLRAGRVMDGMTHGYGTTRRPGKTGLVHARRRMKAAGTPCDFLPRVIKPTPYKKNGRKQTRIEGRKRTECKYVPES